MSDHHHQEDSPPTPPPTPEPFRYPTDEVSTHAVPATISGSLGFVNITGILLPTPTAFAADVENEESDGNVNDPTNDSTSTAYVAPAPMNPSGMYSNLRQVRGGITRGITPNAHDENGVPNDNRQLVEVDLVILGDVSDSERQTIVSRIISLSHMVMPGQSVLFVWNLPPRDSVAEPSPEDEEEFIEEPQQM